MNIQDYLPRPELAQPSLSYNGQKIASAFSRFYRLRARPFKVRSFYIPSVSQSCSLVYCGEIVALHLRTDKKEWIYFRRPTVYAMSKQIFDRFNSICYVTYLPMLHQVNPKLWIWSDGVPWFGQRLFRLPGRSLKTTLQSILNDPWR